MQLQDAGTDAEYRGVSWNRKAEKEIMEDAPRGNQVCELLVHVHAELILLLESLVRPVLLLVGAGAAACALHSGAETLRG